VSFELDSASGIARVIVVGHVAVQDVLMGVSVFRPQTAPLVVGRLLLALLCVVAGDVLEEFLGVLLLVDVGSAV
jgi:hypothetical protein